MSLIDKFLAILTPYECLSCSAEGALLCLACTQQLIPVPERCYRCLAPSARARTCSPCSKESDLKHVWAVTPYSGMAKELIRKLKFAGARSVAPQMASGLSPLVPVDQELVVVPVPTATDRVRGRGYDQAKLLAREIARQTKLPYFDCLVRSGHTHQVGSSRRQRLSQLESAFRVNKPNRLTGQSILLIDDVVTTGSTLETAARALINDGAGHVMAAVFAQA